jgi:heptose-I-phosphate ethanolaminephosphotransferase
MQIQEFRAQRNTTLVYFSDHGQEVGHTKDFTGHSEEGEQGYTIPLFVWNNQNKKSSTQRLYDEPYSLEYLDDMLEGILGIHSVWYDRAADPIKSAYYPKESSK